MKIKQTLSTKFYYSSIYAFLTIVTVICLLPFWLMVMGSITKESSILVNGYQLFPKEFSLEAFKLLLTGSRIFKSYFITIQVTVLGTLISMLVTCMLAYAIAVKGIRYSRHIAFFVFFTMLFSGGMVPWYILVTRYLNLGNNIWGLILPYAVNAWYMFLMRNFFRSIPDAITEAARIDGANDIRILFQLFLPLSLPALATIGLFYSLQYWNDWWLTLMLIDKEELYPLQYILRALSSNLMNVATSLNPSMRTLEAPPAYSVRMATVIVTIGPIVFVYPMVQKYFIKGLTVGSVKG